MTELLIKPYYKEKIVIKSVFRTTIYWINLVYNRIINLLT